MNQTERENREKQPYTTPRLERYGRVSDLTQHMGHNEASTSKDNGFNFANQQFFRTH
jgi:hypothetical protein